MNAENDSGYIYVTRQEYIPPGIYKVGKTVNTKSTYRSYKRQGNIKKDHIYVPAYLSYVETLVMNIFGPYRTLREDNRKLSEQVQLPLSLIIGIIEWIVERAQMKGKEISMKLSRSIKTMPKYRKKIPNLFWHDMCLYIDKRFPSCMPVPMDISDNDESQQLSEHMTLATFDDFVSRYRNNQNVYNEN